MAEASLKRPRDDPPTGLAPLATHVSNPPVQNKKKKSIVPNGSFRPSNSLREPRVKLETEVDIEIKLEREERDTRKSADAPVKIEGGIKTVKKESGESYKPLEMEQSQEYLISLF